MGLLVVLLMNRSTTRCPPTRAIVDRNAGEPRWSATESAWDDATTIARNRIRGPPRHT